MNAQERAAEVLVEHRREMTGELLRCSCGWYVERGEGAATQRAAHLADVLAEVGLLAEEGRQ